MVEACSPNQLGGWVTGHILSVGTAKSKSVGERSCLFAQPHLEQAELTLWPHIFLPTSISSSTMCTLPSDPFVEPFYSLKKAFMRLLSPISESADGTSINMAHPGSALPTLITPSSTIRAADTSKSVTSKILSDLPAPR